MKKATDEEMLKPLKSAPMEVSENSDVIFKCRGMGVHHEDGRFEFTPEKSAKGVLFRTIGKRHRDMSLQQSIKSYKVQALVPVDSLNPSKLLLEKVKTVLRPLEPALEQEQVSGTQDLGQTAHAEVVLQGTSVNVNFKLPLFELKPENQGKDIAQLLKAGVNPYVEPKDIFIKEVTEVCSIISKISQTKLKKSAPKRSTSKP